MSSRWLNMLEAHVEKGVLGATAVILLVMLYAYLVRSPNRIAYGNRELGPRELIEELRRDADGLQAAVRGATAEEPKVEQFSDKLKAQHAQGIFAAGAGPELRRELPLATTLGRQIVVPGLEEAEEPAGSVALVTPLRPSPPKLRTGRSLAIREQVRVSGAEPAAPAAAAAATQAPKPEEVTWVSVAAYFDKEAQYKEMIRAGYASYRAKAYVVGVDVQRQEMQSDGQFSEWVDVKPGKAAPALNLPPPVFDEDTGELVNKDELRQAFAVVKEAQPVLMQPPFYTVEGGDFWDTPPLAGFEEEEEEEEEEPEQQREGRSAGHGRTQPPERLSPPPVVPGRPGPPIGRAGGGRTPGRMGLEPERGEGRQAVGGALPGRSAATDEAERKREARKQIRADLKEARTLIGKKQYQEALSLAQRIQSDAYANAGDKRKAKEIAKVAQRWLERESGRAAARSGQETMELVTHPESGQPAVWFHDDSVEAGKTYRYRMRVKLWNRYVGRMRVLKDPAGARQTVIAGEWSLPSEPVTVAPVSHFFLTGGRPTDQSATVDVWRWQKGRWFRERFDVSVGDVIGAPRRVATAEFDEKGNEIRSEVDFATGAVVLDLRFDAPVQERRRGKEGVFAYSERSSTVLVYLDPVDGQVKERVLIQDRRDPKKKQLEDEAW